jgi:uncharacterized membrane protein YeaQ/YmgE (transglycosylase-associated protein family)
MMIQALREYLRTPLAWVINLGGFVGGVVSHRLYPDGEWWVEGVIAGAIGAVVFVAVYLAIKVLLAR